MLFKVIGNLLLIIPGIVLIGPFLALMPATWRQWVYVLCNKQITSTPGQNLWEKGHTGSRCTWKCRGNMFPGFIQIQSMFIKSPQFWNRTSKQITLGFSYIGVLPNPQLY